MTYPVFLKYGLQLIVTISLWTATTVAGAAEQTQGIKGAQSGKPAIMGASIRYKPPLHDDPPAMASGSTRAMEGETLILQVLAPDHPGLTLQPQPTLYWYASSPVATHFSIAAINKNGPDQLIEINIEKAAGIQQLDLGKHNISLQPGSSYQWSVNQVNNKGELSTGVVASGLIERIKPGEGLTQRIKNNHGLRLVYVYAIEGIWYDALETLSSMIDKTPEDQRLVAIRTSLLKQVGLNIGTGN